MYQISFKTNKRSDSNNTCCNSEDRLCTHIININCDDKLYLANILKCIIL